MIAIGISAHHLQYVDASRASDLHQTHDAHRTVAIDRDFGNHGHHMDALESVRSSSDGWNQLRLDGLPDAMWKLKSARSFIKMQAWSNHAIFIGWLQQYQAEGPRSRPNRHAIVAQSPHDRRRSPRQNQHRWKLHDRSQIATRSWPRSSATMVQLKRN